VDVCAVFRHHLGDPPYAIGVVTVPIHREPSNSPRPELVGKYPTRQEVPPPLSWGRAAGAPTRRRKRALGTRAPLSIPQGPNQRWSLDFLSDAFVDGRRFRILAVVDDFTRDCLALVADTSLPGLRVVRELEASVARRGRPAMCVSDNGTELTGMAVLRWCQEIRIERH
jgi:transposase InsO family protein